MSDWGTLPSHYLTAEATLWCGRLSALIGLHLKSIWNVQGSDSDDTLKLCSSSKFWMLIEGTIGSKKQCLKISQIPPLYIHIIQFLNQAPFSVTHFQPIKSFPQLASSGSSCVVPLMASWTICCCTWKKSDWSSYLQMFIKDHALCDFYILNY